MPGDILLGHLTHRGHVEHDGVQMRPAQRGSDAMGARAAPHVEHSRRLVFTDDVEREVAALQQSRTNRTLERMLLVVERVKRGRLFAKVISDELRSVR